MRTDGHLHLPRFPSQKLSTSSRKHQNACRLRFVLRAAVSGRAAQRLGLLQQLTDPVGQLAAWLIAGGLLIAVPALLWGAVDVLRVR